MLRYDLDRLADASGASFRAGSIVSVDPRRRRATTGDGEAVPYDYLLLAQGARMLWSVPGAVTFWGVADEGRVGDVVRELRAGRLGRVDHRPPPDAVRRVARRERLGAVAPPGFGGLNRVMMGR